MNKILILAISITLFFPISSISGEKLINDLHEITITMDGGFGLTFEICNEGNTTIKNINFIQTIDKPIILGSNINLTISELNPGECITIVTNYILGFGSAIITIEISYDNITITNTFKVFLLGFFVILLI